MAGLYIHIPFCYSRCGYCDFFKTTKLDSIPAFLGSLNHEIALRAASFPYKIDTIYFGGGTPSLIHPEFLNSILNSMQRYYEVSANPEITIECNPDDLSLSFLDGILDAGFNRLSIGIQSFNDVDLKMMDRRHNASQAFSVIDDARSAGFNNIGVDFIYGLPWSDLESFTTNIHNFTNLDVQHISAYHLTIEKGTAFYNQKQRGQINEMDDSKSLDQYNLLCQEFSRAGLDHYEVSNFCRDGYHSKHNSAYWNGVPYLGFGPGSHSFIEGKRFWNKADLKSYNSGNFNLLLREETLTNLDRYNEAIMLGLRTKWGVNIETIHHQFPDCVPHFTISMDKWCSNGALFLDQYFLKCHEKSWFQVDGIIEDFILTND
jgi:oxygen-independent coproporphyrinogen-3 oxidase